MKIKIRQNARAHYISDCVRKESINWKWADTLEKVQGMELEVETDFLFKDQYNTAPIPEIGIPGLRIMQRDILEVIDDVRLGMSRCGWCGKSTKQDNPCWNCGKTEYLEPVDYFTKREMKKNGIQNENND